MLAKVRHFVSFETLRNIYFAIFHSVLTYGSQIWGQTENKNIKRIILIQKKALRIINFAEYNSPTSKLFSDSKIIKFTDHIKIQNFLLAHDFINANLPSPLINLFQKTQVEDNPQPSVTRINSEPPPTTTLQLPKVRTLVGLSSVTYRSCVVWNLMTLYFPKKASDQNYKSPCTLSKYTCKVNLRKHLSEKYIEIDENE